jgi:hypothetical protein
MGHSGLKLVRKGVGFRGKRYTYWGRETAIPGHWMRRLYCRRGANWIGPEPSHIENFISELSIKRRNGSVWYSFIESARFGGEAELLSSHHEREATE